MVRNKNTNYDKFFHNLYFFFFYYIIKKMAKDENERNDVNMKTSQKIICFFIIILSFTFLVNTNQSFAKDIVSEIKGFKAEETKETSVTGLKKVVQKFLVALRVASGLLLIVVVASTGIRYITAPANIKGEIKKTGLPIILGLIFIFGASNFAALIISVIELNGGK